MSTTLPNAEAASVLRRWHSAADNPRAADSVGGRLWKRWLIPAGAVVSSFAAVRVLLLHARAQSLRGFCGHL